MITKTLRRVSSLFRAAIVVRRFPGVSLGKAVAIANGALIKATDGGLLALGESCSIGRNSELLVKSGQLEIGDRGHIGTGSVIICRDKIRIGDAVLIAEYVTIRDQDHGMESAVPFSEQPFVTAAIKIGNNVWLGAKCTVLKGVTIGDNTVVGANSVVTHDLPANVIAAGVPARVIRQRSNAKRAVDENPPRH